jgi:GNAT superfamily N-acetyltransferase
VTHTISPPVVVREILPDEHDAAASLLLTVYGAFAGALPPELLHHWLRDVVDPAGGTALGAHVGGRLVGTARLHLDGTYPVPLPPKAAGVRAVAVDPSVRRIGVASALMAECEARARTAGATALHLHTAPFMHAAVALYERLGYRPDPVRDFDVAGHFVPNDPGHAGRGIVVTAYRLDLVPTCRIVRPGDIYEGRQS